MAVTKTDRARDNSRTWIIRSNFLVNEVGLKKQGTIRKRFVLKKSTRVTLRGELITPEMGIPLSAVKGVRASARGITWKGRTITKGFRIKGKVGSLSNDLFVRVKGRRSPKRLYSYTLVQEYEKHETGSQLEQTAGPRLSKAWEAAFRNQARRLGFRVT